MFACPDQQIKRSQEAGYIAHNFISIFSFQTNSVGGKKKVTMSCLKTFFLPQQEQPTGESIILNHWFSLIKVIC